MPPTPGLAYQRALEVLADGKWHDYGEVIRKMAQVVPPGVAMRKTEQMRSAKARHHGGYRNPDSRKIDRPDQRLIEYGALAVARATLGGSVAFEIKPRGTRLQQGPKRVRLVPGATVWRPSDG